MKRTFKEYLIEQSDKLALQKQYKGSFSAQQQDQAAKAAAAEARGAFKKNMPVSPNKGDVIETAAGRFSVLGTSMQGIQVQQEGEGGRTITVPHGTKFASKGQNPSGQTVFTVVK